MALYTELFSEYLEGGGQLPASFDDIEGFTDLFKMKYIDREIGFETETLFYIKLEYKAQLLIPTYKKHIEQIATAFTNAINPTRTFYEEYNTTINAGAQKGQTTDLPFNSDTATPNSITESDPYTNSENRTTTREDGATTEEKFMILERLNQQITPLIEKLLNEFDTLFMGVF